MLKKLALFVTALSLTACAATTTNIEKKDLLVQTRMQHSIFLDPVAENEQIIYVRVRNTSGSSVFNLDTAIKEKMRAMGFKITTNPKLANFMLQANIKNVTEKRLAPDGSGETLVGALVGGVLGAAIGDGAGQRIATTLGAVAGGAAASAVASHNLDITFTAVVDIQVAEKSDAGKLINYQHYQNFNQGSTSQVSANFDNKSEWKKFQTQLISKANKINLTSQEADQAISQDIASSLAGMF